MWWDPNKFTNQPYIQSKDRMYLECPKNTNTDELQRRY